MATHFAPARDHLAVAGGSIIQILDGETAEVLRTIPTNDEYNLFAVQLGPDEKHLVYLSERGVCVYDLQRDERILEVPNSDERRAERGTPNCARLSPDGRLLAVTYQFDADGEIRLYDIASGNMLWRSQCPRPPRPNNLARRYKPTYRFPVPRSDYFHYALRIRAMVRTSLHRAGTVSAVPETARKTIGGGGGHSLLYMVLLIILVAIVAIPIAMAHEKQTRENWRNAAETLGLRFRGKGILESKKIEGTLLGSFVTVDTFTRRSGKSSTTYTRIRLKYPKPLGVGLQLTRQGLLANLTKLFGAQDIHVGDADFDRVAVVKGANEDRIRDFLSPARRIRIQRLLQNYPQIIIDDQSMSLDRQGVIRQTKELVGLLRTLSRVAWHLTGDREEDDSMTAAMEAQDAGHPDEAFRMLRELQERRAMQVHRAEDQIIDAQLVEEHLLAGEILEMAGRHDEAANLFARAQQESPDDTELELWSDRASTLAQTTSSPPPIPGTTGEAVSHLPLDAGSFCREVFETPNSSFAASQVFEQYYAGQTVMWSGPLRRVERMSYDMVFGDEEACRATVEIHVSQDSSYLSAVKAFVKLPPEFVESLRTQVGRDLTFRGRLLKLDAFMRNVYVVDAEVVS